MYTPLYIKSNYTLLSSLITIDGLIKYCVDNNIPSVALTDSNLYKALEFYDKCKNNNIKPIIGLDIKLSDYNILMYAKNYDGYKVLIKLSTIQSEREIVLSDLIDTDNVVVIIPFKYFKKVSELKTKYKDLFIGYSNKKEEESLSKLTDRIVFINETRYFKETDKDTLKYLYMIRDGKNIKDNLDYDLEHKNLDVDIYLLSSNNGLINSNKIANMCNLEFPEKELLLPIFSETNGQTSHEYLTSLAIKGLSRRLNNNVTEAYKKRLDYELDVIEKMGFSNYFLVVYDFIKYAKKNKILVGPGRGSGAGSLVCFSIGITEIDPIKYDLLFERFLNPERITMPDIDTDFPDIYRDQVIEYVKEKYGLKRVSGIITFGTLAPKQALRDAARILNVENYKIDLITKRIPGFTKDNLNHFYQTDNEFKDLVNSEEKLKIMFKIAKEIEGFPRHTSSHAAGIVMSKIDLDEVIPLVKNDDMYLSGYTMEHLENLGLLKMDFLGLKTLTTIMNIIDEIKNVEGKEISFNSILLDDKKVLELFQRGDTTGVFQFESAGMKNFLRNLKPESLEDIFAAIALFRPGPAQNIDSYIRRKEGTEKIEYLDDSLIDILKPTKGIIIYQEQIIQIANVYAGYTLGEADILRRAMSKKKMEVLKKEEERFIERSIEHGHSRETSKKIYDLILSFANYGFNKSHSVAYSLVAYKMAYLKVYFPKYFYASLLTSVIGSEIKTSEYINEIKALNIKVLKPDVNLSDNYYKVEKDGIRMPFSAIKNIGANTSNQIIKNRKNNYNDIFDFIYKNVGANIGKKTYEILINSGCFDSFNYNHKTLDNNLDSLLNYQDLVKDLDIEFVLKPDIEVMEEYDKDELIIKEKDLFGVYITNHPTSSYKAKNNNLKIVPLNSVKDYFNKTINTIIMVDRIKNIRTKKGDEMAFISGSDEYQNIEYTVFSKIYETKLKNKVSQNDILLITGRVERRYDTYQIIAENITKLN